MPDNGNFTDTRGELSAVCRNFVLAETPRAMEAVRQRRSGRCRKRKPADRSKPVRGLVAGWGEQKRISCGFVPDAGAASAPGQLESQGPLPSPRFEPPGCNGRYRRHAGMSQETRHKHLRRQAATPVVRQRTSGGPASTSVLARRLQSCFQPIAHIVPAGASAPGRRQAMWCKLLCPRKF
jgi:hypothetical protein